MTRNEKLPRPRHFPFARPNPRPKLGPVRLPFLLFGFVITAVVCCAAIPPAVAWNRVEIGPMKTSIYIGSVTLTTGTLQRDGATLSASYDAKVFPWFFWGETGRIVIQLTDATYAGLARGEVVDFNGHAQNQKGKPREVTGRVYPAGPNSGKIKVRIHVDDLELIFNGTYTLSTQPAPR